MQSSAALRKIEETEFKDPLSKEPQFGQRPLHSKKSVSNKTQEQLITLNPPAFITKTEEKKIIRIKDLAQEDEITSSAQIASIPMYNPSDFEEQKILPSIIKDVFSNITTFILVIIATTLAVYKVHQVQSTREMTVKYNEVSNHNEQMHKEWLSLLSEREKLTEYSVIRSLATENLSMVQPKTEDEVVIDLR